MALPSQASIPVYDSADEYRPEPRPEPKAPAWCDGSVRIGIHTSIAGNIAGSLDMASNLGCNALQIFSGSPRMWPRAGSRINEADAAAFRARRAELALGPVVIHANYLINLASSELVMRTRSIQAFHDEIIRAAAIGADFLVLHPGSGREKSSSEAIALVAQAIRQAARSTAMARDFDDPRQTGVRLLLENTAGMGAAVGSRFEELQALLRALPELPVGVCLDTAHAFEAGYDLRSEVGLAQTIVALDRTVGLGRVAVVHANDSKTPFASRVDRHEHIGHGKIGLEAFRRIVNHPRLSARAPEGRPGRAFILETPIDAPGDDRRNVRRLWELAGFRASQAPKAQDGFSMLRASGNAPRASRRRKKHAAAPTSAVSGAAPGTRPKRKLKRKIKTTG